MLLNRKKNGGYEYVPPPKFFKTTLEAQRFYMKEKEAWIEGFEDLCGRHYRFLTQGIVESGRGGFKRPSYRFDDRAVFEEITKGLNNCEDLLVYSGRGVGKSLWQSDAVGYNSNVFPGCTQIITACDLDRITKFFNNKIDGNFKHVDKHISPTLRGYSNAKGYPEREYTYNIINNFGEEDLAHSKVFGRQTSLSSKDVTNISGSRGILIAVDEPFLHPYLKELIATCVEVLTENKERIGSMFMAGTLEHDSPQSCIEQLKFLLEHKEKLNIRDLFLPFYHGGALRDDGTSDHKKLIDEWEKKCEEYEKMEDKTFLYNYKKNNPLTEEDVLTLSMEGALPAEVYANIEEQKKIILNTKPPIDRVRVGKEGFSLSSSGKILLYEKPKEGIKYIAGTDPIQAENTASKEGSQLVTIIYNTFTNTPAALYAERTPYSDILANNVINLCDHYNKAVNMIEANAGHILIGKIKELNRRDLLAKQPKRTGLAVKATSKVPIYGVRITGSTQAQELAHELLIKEMLNNSGNIWHLDILNDFANYLAGNSDYVDAYKTLLIYKKEIELRSAVMKKINTEYKYVPLTKIDHTGRRVRTLVKFPVQKEEVIKNRRDEES